MVGFRNSQGEAARGTIVNLQRKSLVMEVYNPYSIVQVSEVLSELTVRIGTKNAYFGKAVVISMVNTGLTAVVSVTLIDEWLELADADASPAFIGEAANKFVQEWPERFQIRPAYQIAVSEMRAFLAEASRWIEQVDLSETLPKEDGKLRMDYFRELAEPFSHEVRRYGDALSAEAKLIDSEQVATHRAYAQAALHPLLLRAPFIHRTYTKPLGYAGDYRMVRQILEDPREGPNTYFQVVNAAFLQSAVAVAHRNRIDILVEFLKKRADEARALGRPLRILNIGCGPAAEVQRFLQEYEQPELLSFVLVDFSDETLNWTRSTLQEIVSRIGKQVSIECVHDSVHDLLKRRLSAAPEGPAFDVVYCTGLFDYLSDKVCARLLSYFASRTCKDGIVLVTNVHSNNPERFAMEHLLEWYLIYRNEQELTALLPKTSKDSRIFADSTGVNIFAEVVIA